eukprot:TRINITY_DN8900_c0_g1_i1.p1 TRINITY_DN8900_c0_g1~~TRINITY_DN8900_c0_g1_i1.p1  ORF type:complete len:308 (+),score=93.82 TRINITY_DN8900_c0_g1_i1:63-986(+)
MPPGALPLLLRQGVSAAARAAPVRCVCFDMTCTLLRFTTPVSPASSDTAGAVLEGTGYPPPTPRALKDVFRAVYARTTAAHPAFGSRDGMTCKEWWRILVRNAFHAAGSVYPRAVQEAVFEAIYARYGCASEYAVYPDALPALAYLRRCGVLVGALSNNCRRASVEILPQLGLDRHLDFALVSQEVGFDKPEPEIYAAALHAAGAVEGDAGAMKTGADLLHCPVHQQLHPHEVVVVGDSFVNDYCGARRAGMKAVLLLREPATATATAGALAALEASEAPDYPGKAADPLAPWVIQSLDALPALLQP